MVLWDISPPSSGSADFLGKVATLRLNNLFSIYWYNKCHELGLINNGEDVTTDWSMTWTWATGGSSTPPLSLELTFCSLLPHLEPFSNMQPWESKILLRPSGWYIWLNSVKPVGRYGDPLFLKLPKTSFSV